MPYEIKKYNNGFKVCKKTGDKKCFSNNPIPLKNAIKQRQAISISEGLWGKGMDIQAYNKQLIDIYTLTDISKDSKFLLKFLENWLIDLASNNKKYKGAVFAFDLRPSYTTKDIDKKDIDRAYEIINNEIIYDNTIDDNDNVIKFILWKALKILIEIFDEDGLNQWLCVDRDVGISADLFDRGSFDYEGVYVLSYEVHNNNIYFKAIAELAKNYKVEKFIYISYLCSSGGANRLLDYLKESMEKKKYLIDFSNNDMIKLESIGAYNTINFYASQGFLIEKKEADRLKEEILSKIATTDKKTLKKIYDELYNKNERQYSEILQYIYSDIIANNGYRYWFKNYGGKGYVSSNIHEIIKNEFDKFVNDEEISGEGRNTDTETFKKYLKKFKITTDNYLYNAKIKAKNAGYNPDKLFFAHDGIHKLEYHSREGNIKFGRVGYKDYIIYKFIAYFEKNERKKKELEDNAEMYRNRFIKSHSAISKIHQLGNLSPNELSIKILW